MKNLIIMWVTMATIVFSIFATLTGCAEEDEALVDVPSIWVDRAPNGVDTFLHLALPNGDRLDDFLQIQIGEIITIGFNNWEFNPVEISEVDFNGSYAKLPVKFSEDGWIYGGLYAVGKNGRMDWINPTSFQGWYGANNSIIFEEDGFVFVELHRDSYGLTPPDRPEPIEGELEGETEPVENEGELEGETEGELEGEPEHAEGEEVAEGELEGETEPVEGEEVAEGELEGDLVLIEFETNQTKIYLTRPVFLESLYLVLRGFDRGQVRATIGHAGEGMCRVNWNDAGEILFSFSPISPTTVEEHVMTIETETISERPDFSGEIVIYESVYLEGETFLF